MSYALFQNGKQISKSHSTRTVVVIEAFERGLVIAGYKDFINDPDPWRTIVLGDNCEIKEAL